MRARAAVVAAHALSLACGFSMAAAVGVGTQGTARSLTVAAVAVVVAAMVVRPFATLAVLLCVAVVALTGPTAVAAAVGGISAVTYLVLRHSAGSGAGLDSFSSATLISALGFTLAGLVATAFPLRLPWLPLAAPLAVFAVYLVATRPFLHDDG